MRCLFVLPFAFISGYALGLWADSWDRRQKQIQMTINDVKKNIEERDSVSEYDSDATQDQTKN